MLFITYEIIPYSYNRFFKTKFHHPSLGFREQMKCIKSTSVSIAVLKQTWWKIFNCPVTNCVISQALSDTPVALSFFSVQKGPSRTRLFEEGNFL